MTDMEALRDRMREFARARDWDQFHSPKNLAMALSVEASELVEHFQWLTEEQSRTLDAAAQAQVRAEIADVLLYLIRLADQLGIDPVAAAQGKLVENAKKYPVDKSRGNRKKYPELSWPRRLAFTGARPACRARRAGAPSVALHRRRRS
jgi:NTP pyrophosphatase (non-canonical NTP hydrolase)